MAGATLVILHHRAAEHLLDLSLPATATCWYRGSPLCLVAQCSLSVYWHNARWTYSLAVLQMPQ